MIEPLVKVTIVGIFVAVCAFVGVLGWRYLFPKEQDYNQGGDPHHYAEDDRSQKGPGKASAEAASKQPAEDRLADYTVWLAIFTGLLALVSALQMALLISAEKVAIKTANAAQTSAIVAKDALVASRRPWIQVDAEAVKGEFDTSGFMVTVKFTLQNKGSDPAFHAFPEWKIISGRFGTNPVDELNIWCDELKARPAGRNTGGFTVFPGQPRAITITATMSRADMDADLAADELRKMAKEAGRPTHDIINPVIIGCADYQFSDSAEHHQTRFAYVVFEGGSPDLALGGGMVRVLSQGEHAKHVGLGPLLINRGAFYAD